MVDFFITAVVEFAIPRGQKLISIVDTQVSLIISECKKVLLTI